MKKSRILIAAAMLIAAVATTASATSTGKSAAATDNASVEALLVDLESKSWVAWQARDGAYFENFLSADHIEIGSGGLSDKASVVGGVSSLACKVASYKLGQMHFTRIAPDTAVLVYRAEQNTTCGGAPVPSPVIATSVYVLRDGTWLNMLYQHTSLAKD